MVSIRPQVGNLQDHRLDPRFGDLLAPGQVGVNWAVSAAVLYAKFPIQTFPLEALRGHSFSSPRLRPEPRLLRQELSYRSLM